MKREERLNCDRKRPIAVNRGPPGRLLSVERSGLLQIQRKIDFSVLKYKFLFAKTSEQQPRNRPEPECGDRTNFFPFHLKNSFSRK